MVLEWTRGVPDVRREFKAGLAWANFPDILQDVTQALRYHIDVTI